MLIQFLTYKNLKEFIESLQIPKEDKEFFIEEIRDMDLTERRKLFETLMKIYKLDQEENKALEKIKKYLKKNIK